MQLVGDISAEAERPASGFGDFGAESLWLRVVAHGRWKSAMLRACIVLIKTPGMRAETESIRVGKVLRPIEVTSLIEDVM